MTKSFKDPGLPVPNPSLSFWLQEARSSSLLGHRTTEEFPHTTDVVIIGAGISGVATAYFLLAGTRPPRSIVILEAREVCYGATGRNAGYCRLDCYAGYPGYKAKFGREQAFKILQNEMDTLNLLTELVEKESIECDFWKGHAFDIAISEEGAELLKAAYHECKADGGNIDGVVELILDPGEAKIESTIVILIRLIKQATASAHPHPLCIQKCIDNYGLNLQTSTPVNSVIRAQTEDGWIVRTARGEISTKQVVYATNAWTAHLLPEYLGAIIPTRIQIVPTRNYSGSQMLLSSSAWVDSKEKIDYIAQRPKDGIIIVGGRRWLIPREHTVDQADDGVKLDVHTGYLKEILPAYLEHWGPEAPGEGMLCDWTGIAVVPFIGDLPDRPGAYICAGHVGHGMARILSCVQGLAEVMVGARWEESKIPECFRPTRDRL
ncbi:fad dependent oxidoreductase superfamily [Moniliophthora roreri MCA 2997]|uniref:Fad dependent oxidoreductase superfamily n=1 Tax=Moniliophthora roreri (strain MCA 2997) TaxID=1381753 RepID=V2XKW5_MONRO|nr:fad dependent oxidoreductase superfamily [Moniliophthora roreri MCA 2997]